MGYFQVPLKALTKQKRCVDKKWPKKCQFNPRHMGDCKERNCNFPKCERQGPVKWAGHHGPR